MISFSNITKQPDSTYAAIVTVDGVASTMSFPVDPSQFSQEILQQMHNQVQEIKMENMPDYIKQLAIEIALSAYISVTDQELCDSLNAAVITKYTPVPIDTMITALVTIGAYPKLKDAAEDKNDPSHAYAIDLLALMNPPVVSLDFSLPAASMLMDAFVATGLASADQIAYVNL